jgi:hypothetical protein
MSDLLFAAINRSVAIQGNVMLLQNYLYRLLLRRY